MKIFFSTQDERVIIPCWLPRSGVQRADVYGSPVRRGPRRSRTQPRCPSVPMRAGSCRSTRSGRQRDPSAQGDVWLTPTRLTMCAAAPAQASVQQQLNWNDSGPAKHVDVHIKFVSPHASRAGRGGRVVLSGSASVACERGGPMMCIAAPRRYLYSNALTGSIPPQLSKLTRMDFLYVHTQQCRRECGLFGRCCGLRGPLGHVIFIGTFTCWCWGRHA